MNLKHFLIKKNVQNNKVSTLFETCMNHINKLLTDRYLNDMTSEVLSTIKIDEKKIPDKCYDLIIHVNENNIEHINMSDTFILVINDELVCYFAMN